MSSQKSWNFLLQYILMNYGGGELVFIGNLSVRGKILGVSLVLIVITALIGLTGYVSLNRVITSMESIYDSTVAQERFLGAMESRLYRLDRTLQAVTMAGSHSEMIEATDRFNQDLTAVRQIWSDYIESLGNGPPEREALYNSFNAKLDEYAFLSDDVINGSVVTAMETAKEASSTIDGAIGILGQVADQFLEDAKEMQADTQQIQDTAHRLLVFLGAGGLILGIVLSLWVAFSVCNPLRVTVGVLDQIAAGNLKVHVPPAKGNDEVTHLLDRLQDMCGSLQQIVGSILDVASNINTSSEEVAAGIGQVGASVQEVAATANQFASNVQQVSEHAQEMEAESQRVTERADEGSSRLSETTARMEAIDQQTQQMTKSISELQERSQEIQSIVTLIVDIAGQTNLLALNAAIEAARAGDLGRGFAVVAEEVRNLANQTSLAAARISELVKLIQEETTETVKQNQKMVVEVSAGAQAMKATDQAFTGIKTAIQAMALRITEVARAASQIGSGSQQIAASTEEQSASILGLSRVADTLMEEAKKLQQAVQAFDM